MTKAVIFDNEWVIVKNDWDRVARCISEKFDVPYHSGKETKQKFRLHDKSKDNILYKWNRGQISKEDFWGQVLKKEYDVSPTKKNIDGIACCMEKLTTDVDLGVVEIINNLKDNGYKLFMLSNSTPEIECGNKKNHDYFDLFDKIYMSFRTGHRKPEKASYETILDEHNLFADNCIFIDDKNENIEGAKELGIRTIEYKIGEPIEKLKEGLDYFKRI